MFKILAAQRYNDGLRRAKTKLPKDIRKKVEEWKFSSGALVMCLVAYSNGENVDTFQSVFLSRIIECFSPHFQCQKFTFSREQLYEFLH